MLVRTDHIAAMAAGKVMVAGKRVFKYHATLPGAVGLDGSIAPAGSADPSAVQAAGAGRGAESISPPVISAAASPATRYCLMALSFTSPLVMTLLVMWPAFAVFDRSLLGRSSG
jgi:hypothetical protein